MTRNFILGASALALSAGAAHAQVNYTSGPNTWTFPGEQSSYIEQINNNNEAIVDQSGGAESVSFINQDNTDNGDGHYADVQQGDDGGFNSSPFSWPNNVSEVNQAGNGEGFALVTQNGTAVTPPNGPNIVRIDQDTLSDGNPLLGAVKRNGDPAGLNGDQFNAVAYASQDGTGNLAEIEQVGAASVADTTQIGDDNVTTSYQEDNSFASNGVNYITVEQMGDRNASDIFQTRLGGGAIDGDNIADVLQDGDDNLSEISQTSPEGGNQLAEVRQVGNNDRSFITQSFSEDGDNRAFVRQEGDGPLGNESRILQEDGFNIARVDQRGDGNDSEINQASLFTNSSGLLGRNRAVVDQDGDGNSSLVNQLTSFTLSGRARAFVTQEGDRNSSEVDQNVDPGGATLPDIQRATVDQILGTVDSTSLVVQRVHSNEAEVTQEAAVEAMSEVFQTGDGNFARVYQTGGAAGMGHTSLIDQTGDDNDADVNQSGMDHDSDIMQLGDGNLADVDQSMTGNISDIMQTGDNNEAYVNQMTDTNYSWINQVGNGNFASVIQ